MGIAVVSSSFVQGVSLFVKCTVKSCVYTCFGQSKGCKTVKIVQEGWIDFFSDSQGLVYIQGSN